MDATQIVLHFLSLTGCQWTNTISRFQIDKLINFVTTIELSYKSKRILCFIAHSYSPICRQVFHFVQNNNISAVLIIRKKLELFHLVAELSADPNRVLLLSIWIISFHDMTLDYPTQQSCFQPSQHRPDYFIWFNSQ